MDPDAYIRLVRSQKQRNPCVSTLLDYLESDDHEQRVAIKLLDFFNHKHNPHPSDISYDDLEELLRTGVDERSGLRGRIVIIEDLTRELVKFLGFKLDIDPIFFASHIRAPNPWQVDFQTPDVALPPSRSKASEFINVHYHRTITLQQNPPKRHPLRKSNVPRKATFFREQRNQRCGIAPHCCSVFQKTLEDKTWMCLILVDRAIEIPNEDQYPWSTQFYLGGYEDFVKPPSVGGQIAHGPNRERICQDLAHYWKHGPPDGFDKAAPSLFALSYYPLRIILAEWMNYVAIMSRTTKKYNYKMNELDQTETSLNNLNDDLRSLQSWLRRTMSTQQKIASVIRFLDPKSEKAELEVRTQLWEDYQYLAASIEACAHRLEVTLPITTSMVQIIDSRQSLREASYISRLTYLALVFLPLTFISGLFSMEGAFAAGNPRFWVYFVVAVPVTLGVVVWGAPKDAQGRGLWEDFKRLLS